MLVNDLVTNIIATVAAFILSLIWLRLNDFIAHKGWMSGPVSRKMIHIGTGPLFVLTWLLYRDTPSARFLAALIPLATTIQFALVGLGLWRDPSAVEAMSRSGKREEILRGPLYYGIVFVVLTLIFWKDSPAGIVAMMILCGGDGLADVVGRRYGAQRLPWSRRKTWAGSVAMFAGGWVFSLAMLAVFLALGVFKGSLVEYLPAISLVALAGTLVESLTPNDFDNLTVPFITALLGRFLF